MSESLHQLFLTLESIYTDPKSYQNQEKQEKNNKSVSSNDIQITFINSFKDKKKIDNETILMTRHILNNLFTSIGLNIDFSGFTKFLKQYIKQKPVCTRFIDQSDDIDLSKYSDDSLIPIEILFKSMMCKKCGHFCDEHKICTKFEMCDDFDSCKTCGHTKYSHNVCSNFNGNTRDFCNSCGRNLQSHQQKQLKDGIYPCNNFIESNDIMECKNCIHTETNHMLNPLLFQMNETAYSNFMDTAFSFQANFIGCINMPRKIIENMEIFYKVLKMNYSKQHPKYDEFCEISIKPSGFNMKQIPKISLV